MSQPVCGKCGKEMTPADSRLRPELFLHDVCLPVDFRLTGARRPQIGDILTALLDECGAIVSSADCSGTEIASADAEGRFYVDADGFGFVLRTKEWRANAEAALQDAADLHRQEKSCHE